MISILSWIVFGLIAGIIAKAIMPGRDPGGAIVTILLGIVGAIVGGFLAGLLGIGTRADTVDGISQGSGFFVSLIFAVIGALVVLAIYRLITGRSVRA